MVTPYLKGNCAGDCPDCNGSGRNLTRPDAKCRTCKGRGVVGKPVFDIYAAQMAGLEEGRINQKHEGKKND